MTLVFNCTQPSLPLSPQQSEAKQHGHVKKQCHKSLECSCLSQMSKLDLMLLFEAITESCGAFTPKAPTRRTRFSLITRTCFTNDTFFFACRGILLLDRALNIKQPIHSLMPTLLYADTGGRWNKCVAHTGANLPIIGQVTLYTSHESTDSLEADANF